MSGQVTLERLARALGGEVRGEQVCAPGPGHSAADRSLSVKPDKDASGGFLVHSFSGDDPIECRQHVCAKLGFEPKDAKQKAWTTISEHIYRSETGESYLRVRKCLDDKGRKQYPQAHWDGKQWLKGKPNGPKIPYRLPELVAAPRGALVYFCEGEKDADNLAKLSLVNTTASEGANADWEPELTQWFKDQHVVILPDADKPGRKHALKVALALNEIAASVKVIDLFPYRTDGGDVSNFLETDTAGVRLARMAREAPLWEPSADGDDDKLIAEFAGLSKVEYFKRRKTAAEKIGIGVGALDKIVAEARAKASAEAPRTQERWQIEPWDKPVATADLLNDLRDLYATHVILPEHGTTTMALWTLHAWTLEAAYCSPFLMFTSPEMRCGKSTALSLLFWTGPRTALASNISPAALFRYVEAAHPTLLIDEAETFLTDNEEARGILNSGHTRDTAVVVRLVGDAHEPKGFSTWAPKALASIGKLAATLRDRAIILPMKRKKRGERVRKLRGGDSDSFVTLRRKAARWAADSVAELRSARPAIPEELNDRAQDNWDPLLAIADLGGGNWPKQARDAALSLSGDAETAGETIGGAVARRNPRRIRKPQSRKIVV